MGKLQVTVINSLLLNNNDLAILMAIKLHLMAMPFMAINDHLLHRALYVFVFVLRGTGFVDLHDSLCAKHLISNHPSPVLGKAPGLDRPSMAN